MPQSRLLGSCWGRLLGLLCVVKGGKVAIKSKKKDQSPLHIIRAQNNLIIIDSRGLKVI
jgi:hypothetical protein